MKGMTNALPVLIDASTLATKSDISDMETKTNANATFATKTALTNLQNSVGDAFSQVAVGSDGKSLDFTALDGQVNNVVLPSNGSSASWHSTVSLKTKALRITNTDSSRVPTLIDVNGKTIASADDYPNLTQYIFSLSYESDTALYYTSAPFRVTSGNMRAIFTFTFYIDKNTLEVTIPSYLSEAGIITDNTNTQFGYYSPGIGVSATYEFYY